MCGDLPSLPIRGAKTNWAKLEKLHIDAESKLCDISPNTINSEEKATRKKLNELLDMLATRMEAITKKAFTLYQQMSGPALSGTRSSPTPASPRRLQQPKNEAKIGTRLSIASASIS